MDTSSEEFKNMVNHVTNKQVELTVAKLKLRGMEYELNNAKNKVIEAYGWKPGAIVKCLRTGERGVFARLNMFGFGEEYYSRPYFYYKKLYPDGTLSKREYRSRAEHALTGQSYEEEM